MGQVPFTKEIVRGAVLGTLSVCGIVLSFAIYQSGVLQKTQAAQPKTPAVDPPAVASPAVDPPGVEPATEIETPAAKLEGHVAAPRPPIGKRSPAAAVNTKAKQDTPAAAAIHEEELGGAAPAVSAAPAEEQGGAAREGPAASSETAAAEPKAAPESRGVRWIKLIGRRLRMRGK